MVRRPAFAAAWGLLLAACALDLNGLGPADAGRDAAAATPDDDATVADETETGPGGDETVDATDEESGDDDASVDATGVGPEASPFTTDAAPADANADAHATACDEDGDGYLAMGSGCAGNDCCDQDAHVHPGQTSFFTTPGACGGYDYDCDGTETPEYGAASCQWSTFSCSGDGFAPPVPGCGDNGTFTSCSIPWYDVFTCDGNDAQQAQGCR